MRPHDLARSILDSSSANREVDVRSNSLLARMPDEDFDRFRPHFSCVQTRKGATLFNPGDKIDQILFPLSGICSLVVGDEPIAIEAGMIGRDGMIGASLLMGVRRLPMRCVVQIEGEALAIAADQFLARLRNSPRSWALLLRYQHYLHLQTTYSLLGTGAGSIEQRVARLLLMLCDRIGDDIPIIHDVMSTMLHVRRAGVTQALHILEGNGAIRARRGRVSIRSREGLEQVAGVAYGPAEAEYERLIGAPLRSGGQGAREGADRTPSATGQERASARPGPA